MRESEIEKHLVNQLKKIGVSTRKCKWLGVDGAPDRLILAMGGIFVELKATGEKPRANQLLEHEKMKAAGLRVEVIDTKEMADSLVNQIRFYNKLNEKTIQPARIPDQNNESHSRC